MFGWVGKILRVDLSQGRINEEDLPLSLMEDYIGGRGMAIRILFDEIDPSIDALDDEVAEAPALASLLERLRDLIGGADEEDRTRSRVGRVESEARGGALDRRLHHEPTQLLVETGVCV